MSSPEELAGRLKQAALDLGFDDARIAPAAALDVDRERLQSWLDAGMHAEMGYMADQPERRADPAIHMPGAKSVLALAASYYPGEHPEPPEAAAGRVARYAWGRDYHRVIGLRLRELKKRFAEIAPGSKAQTFVDSAPLLERAFGRAAGLGFIGKNTMLIHHQLGSWVFLAALVTDLELPADGADTGSCGRCRLCLDACPTGAFPEPYKLDASRCISYWTIETPTEPPPELAARFGDWAFGCDICQQVCPYNHRPLDPAGKQVFASGRAAGAWIDAETLASLDDAGFRKLFKHSPVTRPGRSGMARNARVVLANRKR